jgi:hypothetical protein
MAIAQYSECATYNNDLAVPTNYSINGIKNALPQQSEAIFKENIFIGLS